MRREWLFGVLFCIALVGAACSQQGTLVPVTPPHTASLPAAETTACLDADASSQTYALQTTGGVSGTLSLGPVPSVLSGCPLTVDVATGADASLGAVPLGEGSRSVEATTESTSATPAPILQIELGTQSTTSIGLTGVTFTFPSSVPAGIYPVTVQQRVLGDDSFSDVQNLTLTVNKNGTATLNSLNVPIGDQNVTVLLSVYPPGTVLSTPSAGPTPTPTSTAGATPTPTSTPTSAPTATPTAPPTATPTPVPTATPTPLADCATDPSHATPCGSYQATGTYDGGQNSGQPATSSGTLTEGVNSDQVTVPGFYFTGTIVVTLPGYNPGHQQTLVPADTNCASVEVEQSGSNGDTYTFTFQADGNQYDFPPAQGCGFYVEPPSGSSESDEYFLLWYGDGNGSTYAVRPQHATR